MENSEHLKQIEDFKSAYIKKIEEVSGEYLAESSLFNQYEALAEIVMDKIASQWAKTRSQYDEIPHKRVYLFSIEFLIGRLLKSYVNSLDMEETVKIAMARIGFGLRNNPQPGNRSRLGQWRAGTINGLFFRIIRHLGFTIPWQWYPL